MLSYGAFDSPTYYVDVTPFVPSLCDGQPHTFTLDVVGMGTSFSINQNWIVSGNLQVGIFDFYMTTG
jgi:Peptide N-acetyl-beta-D-glucosaminyl asparaginase amidase A